MFILCIIIFLILLILLIAKLILNMVFGKRCEGNPKLKYFTANDFEGLIAEAIEFKSNKGQILRGNIYTDKKVKEHKGIIVFVHGMGGGHLSYTTEINTFAKAGFIVIGYDNTGTCSSEGKNLKGFFQSVIDLKYALKYINENKELNKYDISLVGHSWGAYTVCQILQYNPNVKAVVAMSGFNNSGRVICDIMKAETKINFNFLKLFISAINFLAFGKGATTNTIDVLKNADVPVLLLQGDADSSVLLENSPVSNDKILSQKPNIKTIIYKDRVHNVYQTKESEKYLNDTFGKLSELNKKYKGKELEEETNKIYDNIDYQKITEEDKEVMDTIIEFIERQY